MPKEGFSKKVKRLSARSWESIADKWINALPRLEHSAVAPPSSLSKIEGLAEILVHVPDTGEYRDEFEILRPRVLHEAIYLLHKAGHVLGAAEQHVRDGLLSWSLSNAYHSSLFSQKATMAFLGLVFPQLNNVTLMIDVWPGQPKGNRKSRLIESYDMQFVRMPALQHREHWELFQRMLRVTTIDVWNKNLVQAILRLDIPDFAKQRNILHYSNHKWIFDDLYTATDSSWLDTLSQNDDLAPKLDSEFPEMSLGLAIVLFQNAIALLRDLASRAPIIDLEIEILNASMTEQRHPYFSSLLVA